MENTSKPLSKNKFVVIAVVVVLIAALAGLIYYVSKPKRWVYKSRQERSKGPCPGETITKTMLEEKTMSPYLEKGQEFKVIMDYYICNPLKRGDFIYYFNSDNIEPVVRKVVALHGDKFQIVKDKVKPNWNLIVNNELLMYTKDQPYYFGLSSIPSILSLYEKSQKGVLTDQELIALTTVPPGRIDSSVFGVYGEDGIIGKVILPGHDKKETEGDKK